MSHAKAKSRPQAGRPRTTVQVPHASPAHGEVERRMVEGSRRHGTTYNGVAVGALENYFGLLQAGRQQVKNAFSTHALDFLAEVLRENPWPGGGLERMPPTIRQAAEAYRGKAREEIREIHDKLYDLSSAARAALVDAVEQFHNQRRRYTSLLDCLEKLDLPI